MNVMEGNRLSFLLFERTGEGGRSQKVLNLSSVPCIMGRM